MKYTSPQMVYNWNSKGERCPNGAAQDCICSAEARNKRYEEIRREEKLGQRFNSILLIIGIIVGIAFVFGSALFDRKPWNTSDMLKGVGVLLVAGFVLWMLGMASSNKVPDQETLEMLCGIRTLLRVQRSRELQEGTELYKIHQKIDALMREVELMREGE